MKPTNPKLPSHLRHRRHVAGDALTSLSAGALLSLLMTAKSPTTRRQAEDRFRERMTCLRSLVSEKKASVAELTEYETTVLRLDELRPIVRRALGEELAATSGGTVELDGARIQLDGTNVDGQQNATLTDGAVVDTWTNSAKDGDA